MAHLALTGQFTVDSKPKTDKASASEIRESRAVSCFLMARIQARNRVMAPCHPPGVTVRLLGKPQGLTLRPKSSQTTPSKVFSVQLLNRFECFKGEIVVEP